MPKVHPSEYSDELAAIEEDQAEEDALDREMFGSDDDSDDQEDALFFRGIPRQRS